MDKQSTFNVGDTVEVATYQVQTMSGLWVDGYCCGKTAIILELTKDYAWRTEPNQARLRIIEGDNEQAWGSTENLANLRLVQRGEGRVELGVTHPWTQTELQEQRWVVFVDLARGVSLTHEGFSNAATYLAWLYLNQEPRAHQSLKGFVRKDGSLNPNRVRKLFSDMRLRVDDWAYACPIEVPVEFAHRPNPVAHLQQVNWPEVAAEFATQFAERTA